MNNKSMTIGDGFRFAAGAVFYAAIISFAVRFFPFSFDPYDSSDAPPLRSGLRIKTDALTGCQYILTFTGAITPRMNGDEKQICARSSAGSEQLPSKQQVAGSNPAERATITPGDKP